ncbi:hypothetical protein RMATCC62417_04934 [Rhizopus microsporus]|nr:hypothetical protein RMATCC62417_04934 [Rhizopus microsporus]CEJ04984.1 hypothetical protein RMCBS344292_18932 [Rhizopus microsporus]
MSVQQYDMSSLAHRLKARLTLANFKREHGYENVDLHTLESSLFERVPTKPSNPLTKLNIHDKKRKRLLSHHRFYPTSPPFYSHDRTIKHHAPRSPSHVPISDTRLRPYEKRKLSATLSSDDEDAAHLLVMMHHSPTMS